MSYPVSIANGPHYTWGEACEGWHLVAGERLSVIEEKMPPGTTEMAHYHEHSHQFFYVLEGTLTIALAKETYRIGPNTGLEIAPRVRHHVQNLECEPVRFLVLSVPPSHGDRVATVDEVR